MVNGVSVVKIMVEMSIVVSVSCCLCWFGGSDDMNRCDVFGLLLFGGGGSGVEGKWKVVIMCCWC